LAKIAVKSDAPPQRRHLASGDGWAVSDIVCTAGPQDQPFEEQFSQTCVAIVVRGTFQYRTHGGCALMMPGALLLGNGGEAFTCGHEHGVGDRCLSFSYTPEFCETVKAGAGIRKSRFQTPRLAPARALSPLVSRAAELLAGGDAAAFHELGIQLLGQAMQAEEGLAAPPDGPESSSLARVTRVLRMIDGDIDAPRDLNSLARIARLSPYHFLRVFEGLTGTTPHQYLLRARLRHAAVRLRRESGRILDIALGCGFGDVSNFNRAFRAEFGVSPRAYRRRD
jgi:AraC-like DNA-binding protein